MSNAIARIVFASASLVLTCTLAVASASAQTPADAAVRQTIVRYADLNLASPAGRATLERRLHAAADAVCADSGSALDTLACRSTAIAKARVAAQRALATAS